MDYSENDNLGRAALAKKNADNAIKTGNLDFAWRYLNEQKMFYMKHSSSNGFTASQILLLDSTVSESMANLLRIEKRHSDAFVHILYWVMAQRSRPLKRHQEKLKTYFKRCNFKNTTLKEVVKFSKSRLELPEYVHVQTKVKEWMSKE